MGEIALRVGHDLLPFLSAKHRDNDVRLAHDGTSTVGHVIESVGIPLPEVGEIVVGGIAVPPSHRLLNRDTVHLHAVARPQVLPADARGFVLDVHLGSLARRLRIVGVDTAYRNDVNDAELVDQANSEHRVLLTRDRRLLMRRSLWQAAYVRGDHPDEQLADVIDRFALELTPWTRCTACNGMLQQVNKSEVSHLLRPGTRRTYTTFARCDACEKIYWRGAHSRRLEAIVHSATTR